MKVLFIQPPYNPNIIGANIFFLGEPLSLEILAASIAHHDVRILDMRIDADLNKTLDDFQPDIVGITGLTADVYIARDTLSRVKEYNRDILTVVGGHHATMVPEDFCLDFIDAIVIGGGEITLRELVDAHQKKTNLKSIKGLALPTGKKKLIYDFVDLVRV